MAVLMNIYYLRMNGFSTETEVCLQTLHYSVLIGVAKAFYAQIIHMITCIEVFAKSPAFLDSIFVYVGWSGSSCNLVIKGLNIDINLSFFDISQVDINE